MESLNEADKALRGEELSPRKEEGREPGPTDSSEETGLKATMGAVS